MRKNKKSAQQERSAWKSRQEEKVNSNTIPNTKEMSVGFYYLALQIDMHQHIAGISGERQTETMT